MVENQVIIKQCFTIRTFYNIANATILEVEAVIRKFAALPDCCHMVDGKLLFRSLLNKLVKLA